LPTGLIKPAAQHKRIGSIHGGRSQSLKSPAADARPIADDTREPRHFVYSKVMCWVALDRAIRLAGPLRAEDRVAGWRTTRDEIAKTVAERGWSDTAGAFTQSFGSDELDAANLMLPIVGFLPAADPRMLATVDAIEARLTDECGLVYRYRPEGGVDGLAGGAGCFLLCTFWLAQALALAGRTDRARGVFERAAAYANDVGLLSEEIDPRTGELLGNFRRPSATLAWSTPPGRSARTSDE
jgi:GH15 family glucan-1,4-alpha-glucosidase